MNPVDTGRRLARIARDSDRSTKSAGSRRESHAGTGGPPHKGPEKQSAGEGKP